MTQWWRQANNPTTHALDWTKLDIGVVTFVAEISEGMVTPCRHVDGKAVEVPEKTFVTLKWSPFGSRSDWDCEAQKGVISSKSAQQHADLVVVLLSGSRAWRRGKRCLGEQAQV